MVGGATGTPSGRAASLPSGGIYDSQFTYGGVASSGITVAAAGTWSTNPTGYSGTWLTGTGTGVNYDAYLDTSVSGDIFSGQATDTWLSMSSSRTWYVNAPSAGDVNSASGVLKIRDATSLTQLASCDISFTAIYNI
jgi:hypothetical protein